MPPPGRATLDWAGAQIILPLDVYGMTTGEKQIINAAQTVVAWRCLKEGDSSIPDELAVAREWLEWNPEIPMWLYGVWDSDYVASEGILPPTAPNLDSFPANSTPEQIASCVARSEYQSMSIVDRRTISGDGSLATAALMRRAMEAHVLTEQDPRFVALVDERAECLAAKGYRVGDYPLRAVDLAGLATDEQIAEANLAEAVCSDQMNLTQQAADIQAGYEQQFIDENQAELVEIKRTADERVARATEILEEVGLL